MKTIAAACSKSLLTLALLGLGAQAAGQESPSSPSDSLSDGQIIQIIKTLNDGEIMHGETAEEMSDDEAVVALAQLIQADHEMSNMTIEMLEEEGAELEESAVSERVQTLAMQASEQLEGLEGQEFDCAFLAAQADLHQMALEMVSSQLLPQAEEESVRQLLNTATMSLEHHLHTAETARDSMQGCTAGA